jgi:hypothetical protein
LALSATLVGSEPTLARPTMLGSPDSDPIFSKAWSRRSTT